MACMIGVDGGTESLRARVFDLTGRSLGTGAYPYATRFAPGARAEQAPEDWWVALGHAVRQAVAGSGVAADQIEAIALDTTCCTVVALDAAGRALRPAILWMDMRAGQEAADVLATGDPALIVNGAGRGPVSAEWMIPKALWLSRHEPALFDRATTICEYQDFLTLRLTGRRAASLNNATVRWHYATDRGGPPTSLLRALGLAALEEKWPADVIAPGAVIGPLTAEAAAHLGLPATVKVVQGGADAQIGIIGLGVARPGQLALITGSSHLQFGVGDAPLHAPGLWGTYKDAVYPGRYILEGGQTSTGSIIAWLRRLAGGTLDLARLNEEAAALPPGAEGLLALDHFQGNRTPHTDPLARGAIVGLSLHHGMAHIFRAVMEGIGFGTRAIVDGMRAAGFEANEIVAGGGATNSPLWLQIHADTADLPVVVPDVNEAPALGSAILAAVGAGRFATIEEGIAAMVRPGRRIEPIAANVARYQEIYARYAALYAALKPLRAPMADAP
jgi:ribulokinase